LSFSYSEKTSEISFQESRASITSGRRRRRRRKRMWNLSINSCCSMLYSRSTLQLSKRERRRVRKREEELEREKRDKRE
jgi:hypothetical protein